MKKKLKGNKYRKLGKNTLLLATSHFSSKFLVFLLLPIYTRCLTAEEYGIADLIFSTIELIYPILTLLIFDALLRFLLEKDSNINIKDAVTFSLLIFVSGFIILVLLSNYLTTILGIDKYNIFFLIYYLVYILYIFYGQLAKGIGKVKEVSIAGVISTIVTIASNIIFLIYFKMGIIGYLISYILGMLLAGLYLVFHLKLYKYINKTFKINGKLSKDMLKYSIPIIPTTISWWIGNSSDKYMINYYAGPSTTGIYSISYKIPNIIMSLTFIFNNSWQLSAVDDFGTEESRKFYSTIYKKYSIAMMIIVLIVIFLSRILAIILFDNSYFVSWESSCILTLSTLFYALSTFLSTIYTSAKKTNNLLISTLLSSIINIIFNFILIPKYNMIGAAIATLIGHFTLWIYRILDTKKIVDIKIPLFEDIICYLIIIFEIILMEINSPYLFVLIPILVVLIIKRKELILLVNDLKLILSRGYKGKI